MFLRSSSIFAGVTDNVPANIGLIFKARWQLDQYVPFDLTFQIFCILLTENFEWNNKRIISLTVLPYWSLKGRQILFCTKQELNFI